MEILKNMQNYKEISNKVIIKQFLLQTKKINHEMAKRYPNKMSIEEWNKNEKILRKELGLIAPRVRPTVKSLKNMSPFCTAKCINNPCSHF